MPGAFAHLTLVGVLAEQNRLEQLGLHDEMKNAIGAWFKFCELGSISPDYPYLSRNLWGLTTDHAATRWAEEFHLNRTVDVIRIGAQKLVTMTDIARSKCMAWLLGYSAHVGMDVTLHPVIERIAGPYYASKENQEKHRTCEMNQDVYIWEKYRPNLGRIGVCEHLSNGIAKCSALSTNALDEDLKVFWQAILQEVYPEEFASNPPDLDKWHKYFLKVVDNAEEAGNRALFPLSRHMLKNKGMLYPLTPESRFIDNLEVPMGTAKSYDTLFELALENVGRFWKQISDCIYQENQQLAQCGNWSLDNGRYLDGGRGEQYVFWA